MALNVIIHASNVIDSIAKDKDFTTPSRGWLSCCAWYCRHYIHALLQKYPELAEGEILIESKGMHITAQNLYDSYCNKCSSLASKMNTKDRYVVLDTLNGGICYKWKTHKAKGRGWLLCNGNEIVNVEKL